MLDFTLMADAKDEVRGTGRAITIDVDTDVGRYVALLAPRSQRAVEVRQISQNRIVANEASTIAFENPVACETGSQFVRMIFIPAYSIAIVQFAYFLQVFMLRHL